MSRDRYQGFELRSVCWGYREVFAQAIDGLYEQGLLGDQHQETTAIFFEQLRHADSSCYDHVLKEFLASLNPRTHWLLDLPAVFGEVTALGHRFGSEKLYYGITFFKLLGEGAYGDSPAHVRHLVTLANQLLAADPKMAYAFLQGYRPLLDRLTPPEIDLYVQEGIRLYGRGSDAGYAFLAGTSKASESVIVTITRECRLHDMHDSLAILLKAIVGQDIDVEELGQLDADELIQRGTRLVCLYRWLYLPLRIRHFDNVGDNRRWYLLSTVAAAAMLAERTFCAIHGHREYSQPNTLAGDDPGRLNLFFVLDTARALRAAQRHWPGCRNLLRWGFETEFRLAAPKHPAEELLRQIMLDEPAVAARLPSLFAALDRLCNTFDTARELDEPWAIELAERLGGRLVRAFGFLPDFFYPAAVQSPPADSMVADLKEEARQRRDRDEGKEAPPNMSQPELTPPDGDEKSDDERSVPARYWYPEWNLHENDYMENWCGVAEPALPERPPVPLPEDVTGLASRVSRIFERLRPLDAVRERRLETGDAINTDRLVAHRVQRRLEPDPKVDFYEKPLVSKRNLAVLILLDVSGSTGASHGARQVLDIEKHAAIVLGQGLHLLGDRFAVCGFSSNGRENCEYYRFKNFDESWNPPIWQRILAAYPRSSTRIGPALRHSAWLLSKIDARQRLIILVTDGQPMDSGYDPHTRYAQHDVRMACQESERAGIATYAISTEENSLADLEIMFPRRRFSVLPDLAALPRVLPNLYLRLTF